MHLGRLLLNSAWDDWRRVNERVVVEAAPVAVDSYLVDVKNPTDAELTSFYNTYKNKEPHPDFDDNTVLPSAKPAFRIPRKIDLEYIEANFDDLASKEESKITDAEIAKYYEEKKDPMFIKADTGLMEDKGEKKDAKKPGDASAPMDKGAGDAAPKTDTAKPPAADGKSAADAKSATDEKPSADSKTAPAASDAKAEEKPAAKEEKSPAADDKEDEAKESKKDGKQSSLESNSSRVFHLVAFDETSKKDETPAPDAKAATDDKSTAKDTTPDAKAAEAATKPAETPAPPKNTEPANTTAAPATTPAAGLPVVVPPASAAPPAAKKPPEFQPLDQVKDIIRRQLAEQKVADELPAMMTRMAGQLEGEYDKYSGEVLNADADKKAPPPTPKSLTDLAPLAEKNGLKSGKTGPMSELQLLDTPLGKTTDVDTPKPLLGMLFASKEIDLFKPVVTRNAAGDRFIVLKTSDTPSRVPPLSEIRDEVVKAWKHQKAAELAEKHAQETAKKAEASKQPLMTYFADDPKVKVVRTDPFSELTGGDIGVVNGQLQQQPYRLSQPDGIVSPGPEFMKQVFQLKDGEVTAALNNDHTIAYVIRMVEHQPPLAELRSAFLAEANNWPGLRSMMQGRERSWTRIGKRDHGRGEPHLEVPEGPGGKG